MGEEAPHKKYVLIADDEPGIINFLTANLRLANYKVISIMGREES
jgi:DNA-binding response OmpR family regulator